MLSLQTAMGITGFDAFPSIIHFNISPATRQGKAADAVAAFAVPRWLRPLAPEIFRPSQLSFTENLECRHCPWQKGTNENSNGLLREFYPKGRNLSRVSPTTLKQNLALLNARPRKVLNFHSPKEMWELELEKLLHLD